MKALIKINDPTDIIAEPFPAWLDPVAFSVFDCYGYAFCSEYDPEKESEIVFSEREIENPFRSSDEDPAVVTLHIAEQL